MYAAVAMKLGHWSGRITESQWTADCTMNMMYGRIFICLADGLAGQIELSYNFPEI